MIFHRTFQPVLAIQIHHDAALVEALVALREVRVAVATAAISMVFIIFIIELLCHLLNSMMALTSLPIDREMMIPSAIL